MKKNNLIIYSLMVLASVAFTGCNKWLDIYPENSQSTDKFWQSKEEVEEVLMGAYSGLRDHLRKFIQWGELRGDGLTTGAGTSGTEELRLKDLGINAENSICKWEEMYAMIGRANSVIKYSDGVLDKDITFTEELSKSFQAEAMFLRCLGYFYLVRTFGDVPYVTEPYVDDSQPYIVPKSDKEDILNWVVQDLTTYLQYCKYSYEGDWQSYGRVTRWAYYALLADIYLWQEDYESAIRMCDMIMTQTDVNKFELVPAEEWYTIFNPGNSSESIFELQWSKTYSQTNDLYKWFFNGTENTQYLVSEAARNLFEDESLTELDIRGKGASYLVDDAYKNKIWKYAGTGFYGVEGGDLRGEEDRDANWIIYRYSEIWLMKAEALVMQGKIQEAYQLVKEFRSSRNLLNLKDPETSERDALIMVMDERHREFLGEGKRWFDILRMAKKKNFQYKDYLTSVLLLGVDVKDRSKWLARISDPNSYYLPVHKQEITNSQGIVVQNPYYVE